MPVLRTSILFPMLLAICACAGGFGQTSTQILKKDDLTFRKQVYTDETSNKMPYRLFVPENTR
jgi:predicted peptidase